MYSGLKTATAAEAAVFTGIIPISALVLSHVFLDEPVTIADGFGLGLVLTGVLLITKYAGKEGPTEVPPAGLAGP